jgi:type IV secretory pathway protease TraF
MLGRGWTGSFPPPPLKIFGNHIEITGQFLPVVTGAEANGRDLFVSSECAHRSGKSIDRTDPAVTANSRRHQRYFGPV